MTVESAYRDHERNTTGFLNAVLRGDGNGLTSTEVFRLGWHCKTADSFVDEVLNGDWWTDEVCGYPADKDGIVNGRKP